jgi:hypothetical protein
MINGQRFPRRKMVKDIYSSRTYVWIRRMVLVSLYGMSDLSSTMSDYSDGVWFREMMQLMTLIVYTTMLMLPGKWYVCDQDHYLQYLPS